MKKTPIIPIVVFVVLVGLAYGVLANSHIDIFPGMVCEQIITDGALSCAPETISLLDHNRAANEFGYQEFGVFGWIVLAIVNLGIPGLIAWFLNKKLSK
jgi:hypothetical protein